MATFDSELQKVKKLMSATNDLECEYVGDLTFYPAIKLHIESTTCGLVSIIGEKLHISFYCDGY